MSHEVVVVYVTCPTEDDALRIARHLVEGRFAACVNVVPLLRSVYRWEGAVQEERELLLLVKTTREGFEALSSAVRQIHPYSVPEIIAVPVADGYDGYLRWVSEGVAPEPRRD
ncbi:MAG: divalent-cation tolerance protein CutA [Deltaproteobacteria bacterium]|nr:divalent-cation tolerance protein CutA [Deltaproteobacteria bacterium]